MNIWKIVCVICKILHSGTFQLRFAIQSVNTTLYSGRIRLHVSAMNDEPSSGPLCILVIRSDGV